MTEVITLPSTIRAESVMAKDAKEMKAPLRKLLTDEITLGSEETESDATRSSKVGHPHPTGFKELRERV